MIRCVYTHYAHYLIRVCTHVIRGLCAYALYLLAYGCACNVLANACHGCVCTMSAYVYMYICDVTHERKESLIRGRFLGKKFWFLDTRIGKKSYGGARGRGSEDK